MALWTTVVYKDFIIVVNQNFLMLKDGYHNRNWPEANE